MTLSKNSTFFYLITFFLTLSFYISNANDWYSTFSQEAFQANSCDKVIQLLLRFLTEAEKNPEINLHLDDMAYAIAHQMTEKEFLEKYGYKYFPYCHLIHFVEENACWNNKELFKDAIFIRKTLIRRVNKVTSLGSLHRIVP